MTRIAERIELNGYNECPDCESRKISGWKYVPPKGLTCYWIRCENCHLMSRTQFDFDMAMSDWDRGDHVYDKQIVPIPIVYGDDIETFDIPDTYEIVDEEDE